MLLRHQKILPIVFSCLVIFLIIGQPAKAHSEALTVSTLNSDGTKISSFAISTANLAGGASLVVADLGTDGVPEIIIGNGLGNEPRVRVYRQDGSEVGSFLAYTADMGTGITLTACDVNHDGLNEIITGTQYGGGPHIRTFDNLGNVLNQGFFAYNQAFTGGVNLACGDVDNDGANELITGAGPSGGPHVRVWSFDNKNWNLEKEFFAFDTGDRSGIIPFVKKDNSLIIISEKGAVINFVEYNFQLEKEKLSTVSSDATGVLSVSELNNEIIFSLNNKKIIGETGQEKFSFESASGGSIIFVTDLDNNGTDEIITTEARPMFGPDGDKYILVDLSEQRLYAYQGGNLANTFLISAAKYPFTTPVGIHSVLAKKPYVDYTWNYGEGNPDNYSLGMTPWNLNFYGHFYIHYAYWHNNFGHPMSHGCVNVNLTNMKWVYDWAEVGIPVEVRT
ncbi:MAG: L,D-transpeptidase [Candidatus Uhrbacteria bacterium]